MSWFVVAEWWDRRSRSRSWRFKLWSNWWHSCRVLTSTHRLTTRHMKVEYLSTFVRIPHHPLYLVLNLICLQWEQKRGEDTALRDAGAFSQSVQLQINSAVTDLCLLSSSPQEFSRSNKHVQVYLLNQRASLHPHYRNYIFMVWPLTSSLDEQEILPPKHQHHKCEGVQQQQH